MTPLSFYTKNGGGETLYIFKGLFCLLKITVGVICSGGWGHSFKPGSRVYTEKCSLGSSDPFGRFCGLKMKPDFYFFNEEKALNHNLGTSGGNTERTAM